MGMILGREYRGSPIDRNAELLPSFGVADIYTLMLHRWSVHRHGRSPRAESALLCVRRAGHLTASTAAEVVDSLSVQWHP